MTGFFNCPTCASEVPTDWRTCGYCGSNLVFEPVLEEKPKQKPAKNADRQPFPAWLAIALGSGVALSLVVVGLLSLFSTPSKSNENAGGKSPSSSMPTQSSDAIETPEPEQTENPDEDVLPYREPPANLAVATANSGGFSASTIQGQLIDQGICSQELTKSEFFAEREKTIYYEQWDADLVRECIAEGEDVGDIRWVTIFVGDQLVRSHNSKAGLLGNQVRIFDYGWAIQTNFMPAENFDPIYDDRVVSSIYDLLGGDYVQP